MGMYLGPPCYGYALNYHLVYLINLLISTDSQYEVIAIIISSDWNYCILRKTFGRGGFMVYMFFSHPIHVTDWMRYLDYGVRKNDKWCYSTF